MDLPPTASSTSEKSGADTNIDLALLSRAPAAATRALERSTELINTITSRWKDVCSPIAPRVALIYTFCRQQLGPSGSGWILTGLPLDEPSDADRRFSPHKTLFVEEPSPELGKECLNFLRVDASLPFEVPAKVIGVNSAFGNFPCRRALQFPRTQKLSMPNPLPLEEDVLSHIRDAGIRQWITFHTGEAESVLMFIAAFEGLVSSDALIVRELDEDGLELRRQLVRDLSLTRVTESITGLPETWLVSIGLWQREILPVATFLAGLEFQDFERWTVFLRPVDGCEKIELLLSTNAAALIGTEEAPVLIGAIEVISKNELRRIRQAEAVQRGEIDTLTGYLKEGDKVPLLAGDTAYKLSVTYKRRLQRERNVEAS